MLRKLLLFSLTGASIAFSIAGAVGQARWIHGTLPLSSQTALHLRFSDGLMRLLLTHANKPVRYSAVGIGFTITTRDGIDSARLQFVTRAVLRAPSRLNPKGVPAVRWRWVLPVLTPGAATVEISSLRCPAWVPPVLCLIYPTAIVLFALRRRRIPQPGLCPQCAYDLTGNLSGLCPECGSVIAGHRISDVVR